MQATVAQRVYIKSRAPSTGPHRCGTRYRATMDKTMVEVERGPINVSGLRRGARRRRRPLRGLRPAHGRSTNTKAANKEGAAHGAGRGRAGPRVEVRADAPRRADAGRSVTVSGGPRRGAAERLVAPPGRGVRAGGVKGSSC